MVPAASRQSRLTTFCTTTTGELWKRAKLKARKLTAKDRRRMKPEDVTEDFFQNNQNGTLVYTMRDPAMHLGNKIGFDMKNAEERNMLQKRFENISGVLKDVDAVQKAKFMGRTDLLYSSEDRDKKEDNDKGGYDDAVVNFDIYKFQQHVAVVVEQGYRSTHAARLTSRPMKSVHHR